MSEEKIRMKVKTARTQHLHRMRVKREEAPKVTPKKLKLLITVINKKKTEFYVDLLQGFEVNMQVCLSAQGTATYETRYLLGLEEEDKTVILSLIREDRAAEALNALNEKFSTIRNGKGIAYTIPLTGVIGVAIYQFLSNNRMNTTNTEEK